MTLDLESKLFPSKVLVFFFWQVEFKASFYLFSLLQAAHMAINTPLKTKQGKGKRAL